MGGELETLDATKNGEEYKGDINGNTDYVSLRNKYFGLFIIPKDRINEEFYQALVKIENQEDIWFDRLDHYKENTFDIVCMKNYLKSNSHH